MARNIGWIKLHRSIIENDLWKDKPFSKGQAWIDLLLLANYETKEKMYNGKRVTFERGTVHLSMIMLADRWGWDKRKVKRFLMMLQDDGMCTVNSTNNSTADGTANGTAITIEKYGFFQGDSTADGTANGTDNGTANGTQLINKERKNKRSNIKSFSQFKQHEYDFEQLEKDLGIK